MASETISLNVDSEAAKAYASAPEAERLKLELLLSLRLRELTTVAPRTLQEVMDEIGQNAESRGLTPETLQSLLSDE